MRCSAHKLVQTNQVVKTSGGERPSVEASARGCGHPRTGVPGG
ncbi:hypothetical protein SGL43_05357 [Streptomyces globisporus]|uniref:Uncharacterized protein n=1 Tax=Streptomyces globisporus TaxID=1908 RepID=A0ABM9H3X4_STRGL|nr:hypothetical protein SGL43_05357 [Streptomyces globisporus]